MKGIGTPSADWEVIARELYELLRDISNRPLVERNPDGVDQAAYTMQLIASDGVGLFQAAFERALGEGEGGR